MYPTTHECHLIQNKAQTELTVTHQKIRLLLLGSPSDKVHGIQSHRLGHHRQISLLYIILYYFLYCKSFFKILYNIQKNIKHLQYAARKGQNMKYAMHISFLFKCIIKHRSNCIAHATCGKKYHAAF